MIDKYTFSKMVVLTSFAMSASTIDTIEVPQGNIEKFPSTFERIVKESESYKDLKLIKNSDLDKIKAANSDDLATFKASVISLQETVTSLKSELEIAKNNSHVNQNSNNQVENSTNVPVLFYIGFIALLGLLLAIYIFQNKKIKETYKLHKSALITVEEEFEDFKRSAIERELKLKREIMDLKNSFKSNVSVKSDQISKSESKTKTLKKT